MESDLEKVKSKLWFYPFELPDGSIAPTYHEGRLDAVHGTRRQMLEAFLNREFEGSLQRRRCIDLACHQGYFATRLANAGAAEIVATDARESHCADTRLICDALEIPQVRVLQSDIHALDTVSLGQFDLVLMFGLIYHLENPVGALRIAHALTGQCCLIETQIIPGLTGWVDFGSYRFVRPIKGTFGIIDETAETHGPETGTGGICLVPSLDALLWILQTIGFKHLEVLIPPADGYEQHVHHKRAMVACWA